MVVLLVRPVVRSCPPLQSRQRIAGERGVAAPLLTQAGPFGRDHPVELPEHVFLHRSPLPSSVSFLAALESEVLPRVSGFGFDSTGITPGISRFCGSARVSHATSVRRG